MICSYCRYAGRQNRLNQQADSPNLTELIRTAHSQCPGGNRCDCQHVIAGTSINRELVPELPQGRELAYATGLSSCHMDT